jgi:FixJ family two-component response regulator
MSKATEIERRTPTTGTLTVLSVSPIDEDHSSLQAIIGHSRWLLLKARDLVSTLAVLEKHEVSVLLCEQKLVPGTWRDVLEHLNAMPQAPSLIVTSRFADDRLWGEALNLGAWDVLAKPFDHVEVIRSVKSAWQRWHDQTHMRAAAVTLIEAAS